MSQTSGKVGGPRTPSGLRYEKLLYQELNRVYILQIYSNICMIIWTVKYREIQKQENEMYEKILEKDFFVSLYSHT